MTATTDEFKDKVKAFYASSSTASSDIHVYLSMYDADGLNITDPALAVTYEYEIELRRLIVGFSTGKIQKISGDISFVLPLDHVQSLPPYTGYMRVRCRDSNGKEELSEKFKYDYKMDSVQRAIIEGCRSFVDRIQVLDTYRFGYNENGREFLLTFRGYDADPGQFELELDESNDLYGIGGQTKETVTIQEYSHKNVFYEPIPFELLRTYETKPQITITVDGQPVVCKNLDCDFSYIDPVGEVTSFSFDDGTDTLTVQGVDLPSINSDYRYISFAQSECEI